MATNNDEKYEKSKASTHGNMYEMNILFYAMLRCTEEYPYHFKIATQMENARKFDDVVIQISTDDSNKEKVFFIQAKHKLDKTFELKKVNVINNSLDSPFSLLKYFKSFLESKEKFPDDKYETTYYMFTNANFNNESFENDKITLKEVEVEPLLQFNQEDIIKPPHYYKLEFAENHPFLVKMKNVNIVNKDYTVQDSDIKDFLDKFIWMVNLPDEPELCNLIGKTIAENLKQSEVMMNAFTKEILDWIKSPDGVYWTNHTYDRIVKSTNDRIYTYEMNGVGLNYMSMLEKMNLAFKEIPKEIEDFLKNVNQHKIAHLITQYVDIGAVKVIQALNSEESEYKADNFIIIKNKNFQRKSGKILKLFDNSSSNKLLVLTFDSSDNVIDLSSINNTLKNNNDKKVLLISGDKIKFTNVSNEDMKIIRDKPNFSFLSDDSKKTIMKKNVLFQDREATLGGILCVDDPEDLTSQDMDCLESILDNLLSESTMKIGNALKSLEEVANCYIVRGLDNYELDENAIKYMEGKFAITGKNAKEIINNRYPWLRGYQHYKENMELDRVRLIMLNESAEEAKKEFTQMKENGKNMRHSIHLVKVDPIRVIWLDSHRNDGLKKYLKQLMQDSLLKEEKNRIITINDSAGMGKSTVLTSICQIYKDLNPSNWVVRLDLNYYIKIFRKQTKDTILEDEVVEYFIEKLLNNDVLIDNLGFTDKTTKILFKHALLERGEVILVLDGFDEISPSYKDLVVKLITGLANRTKVKKLITSTRPHTKECLLTYLDSALFSLIPFTQQQQETCLEKKWSSKLPCSDEEYKRLVTYTQAIIKMMSESIHSSSFTAVPLQIMMLSEVFKDQEGLTNPEWQSCTQFIGSNSETPILPIKFNITTLFQKFVDKKLTIYENEKMVTESNAGIVANKLARDKIYKKHKLLAVHVLFSKEISEGLMNESEKKKLEEYFENGQLGVIQGLTNDTPNFIHRTFAEYFGSYYLLNVMNYGTDSSEVQEYMMNTVLVVNEYCIIRAFLNSFLKEEYEEIGRREAEAEAEAAKNAMES